MSQGRTRPGMPGLLHGKRSMQLRYRVPEGPPSLTESEPNPRAKVNMHRVSWPLPGGTFLPDSNLPVMNSVVQTGNCIARTRWLLDSTWLDTPAGGRASIFPQRMEHQNAMAVNYSVHLLQMVSAS